MSSREMVVITDIITLRDFFQHAIDTAGGFSELHLISPGLDGIQEMQALFTNSIRAGELHALLQVCETPVADNGSGVYMCTFALTLSVAKKLDATVVTTAVKLEARNETWLKTLRLVGLLQQAADWYAHNVTEIEGEAYEVLFDINDDNISPLTRIANAQTQGWLVEIDISIPVNKHLYGV